MLLNRRCYTDAVPLGRNYILFTIFLKVNKHPGCLRYMMANSRGWKIMGDTPRGKGLWVGGIGRLGLTHTDTMYKIDY